MRYHVSFDIDFKHNDTSGKLIALEGIDGSGKTTQVKRIASLLRKSGKTVFITKNPTDGIVGKLLRKILDGKIKLSPVSFQYLYTADRQLQQEELIPHLRNGEYVITDRYFWSALAYGLSDKKGTYSNEDMLMAAHCILSMYHQQLVPDKTFYLDISVATAMKRLAVVHRSDIYEKEGKLQTIRKEYRRVIQMFPEQITVIDAEKPLTKVTQDIWSMLQSLMADKLILGFTPQLVPLVIDGTKTVTYRLEDKYAGVKPGDILKVKNSKDEKVFGKVTIIDVSTVAFKDLPLDRKGHERYRSKNAQREKFETYYARKVVDEEPVIVLEYKFSV